MIALGLSKEESIRLLLPSFSEDPRQMDFYKRFPIMVRRRSLPITDQSAHA